MAKELSENGCYVALTHDHLDAKSMMDRVRSPKAGAIVLFAGKHHITAKTTENTLTFSEEQRETIFLESP
jgi:molybdopterin synthase catalytic subunit